MSKTLPANSSTPRIMFVAGEASGDQHAADVVRQLRVLLPNAELFGMGGDLMRQAGVTVELDLVSHAVIGIVEALAKLGDFIRILKQAEEMLRTRKPSVVVLTDFPDLNFRIAAKAKALGIPVVYYISPQVWAWRRGRVNTLKKLVDKMLVVFPFEEQIYQTVGIPVSFVGHPLLDLVKPEMDPIVLRKQILAGSTGPIVALLPGSRRQEIEFILPTMAAAGRILQTEFPGIRFILPLARTVSRTRVETILQAEGLVAELVTQNPYACRATADLAMVASGTATLETAILGTPMLIVYRMKRLSYWLARWFVKLPYFGLANVTAGKLVAPEFLQDAFNPQAVAQTASRLLKDPEALLAQKTSWDEVKKRLGGPGAAKRAAQVIAQFIP